MSINSIENSAGKVGHVLVQSDRDVCEIDTNTPTCTVSRWLFLHSEDFLFADGG